LSHRAGRVSRVVAAFVVADSDSELQTQHGVELEPEMERPFKLPGGYTFGIAAMVVTLFFIGLYMPGAPSALLWPREWAIVVAWIVLGAVLFALSRRSTTETAMEETRQPASEQQ
jgi:amino acid transporter